MNLADIPNRVGYRGFACGECEHFYMLLTRDRFSRSGDECLKCNNWNHPCESWGLNEIVDKINNRWLAAVDEVFKKDTNRALGEDIAVRNYINELKTRMEATE